MALDSSFKAVYTAPKTFDKTFAYTIEPLPALPTTKQKISYLSSLRSSVIQLQEEVNAFLTEKMEEDRASAATATCTQSIDHKKTTNKGDNDDDDDDDDDEENQGEEENFRGKDA